MMDDDAPLLQLTTKGKAPKFDDDTPLASLADPSKQKSPASRKEKAPAPPKAPSQGAPKAKGKGKGKPATPGKRKKAESSSSSSSSDSSSSDSDSEAPKGKGGGKASKSQKLKLLKKKTEDGGLDGGGAVKNRDRSVKEQVVAQLLCRWWYAMPTWPPEEESYYEEQLQKRSLRKVSIQEWEWLPEQDDKGRSKVYELSQFKGVYRDSHGALVDLRPKDTCPCYSNFMKKELPDLYDLLVKAYEAQMEDLKNSKYNEAKFSQELKVALTHFRDKAYQARQMGGPRKAQ